VTLLPRSIDSVPFQLSSSKQPYESRVYIQFSSVQFIDSMPQLNDRITEQICRQWKRTKRHPSALTIALKLGLEKH